MATEDADALTKGECEWESAVERVRGATGASGWGSKLGCAWLDGTQVALGYARVREAGTHADSLSLSGKTTLRARPTGGLGLTLAWELASLKLPGAGHQHDSSTIALVASQGLGAALVLHANLGATRSKLAGQTVKFWALGLERSLRSRIDLL